MSTFKEKIEGRTAETYLGIGFVIGMLFAMFIKSF